MATPCTHLKREQRTRSDFRKWCSATILPAAADSPNYSCCCAPEKPGRSSSRRNTSVAFSPNRTKPPAISFTISGRQVGVSCIINCPVTGVNPNIFCSLTRVRFGAPAFVSPRLSLLASQTERRAREAAGTGTWRLRSGPDRGSHHHWSGSGGGRQGRGLLTAAGRGCLSVYIV